MQIKKQKSLIQEIRDEYQAEVKKLKRKKFLLKAKLLLTIVLPVFIILLSVKVIKTFVRIKVRDIFSKKPRDAKGTENAENVQVSKSQKQEQTQEQTSPEPEPLKPAVPVPAVMTPVEKEIITPVPVVTESVTVSE
ncbi:glycoside hydrolase family 23 [Hungatella hominis]|uniref:Glycoside hydrolase family 23 n=1 Tax=Hungatella hominis TaxID=2763050 RepID=A0ABR7H1D2_9FIRM|nr:glycoside hydrolase family 23 [Hungatella hominis]MBC5706938.1 glycoside hydrolase family 23 [Hungatella hominis]